jgi:hydrogenase maturation protease
MAESAPILILGLGNLLLSDDGVGVHAVRVLAGDRTEGVLCVDVGTAVLHALSYLERAEKVLVIDAVKGGKPPGTIYQFEMENAADSGGALSLHSLGLKQAMKVLAPDVRQPSITVLGVEPASLEYGTELSPEVHRSVFWLAHCARRIVARWQEEYLSAKLTEI